MKNSKTFKYVEIDTQELERIKLEPTGNIKIDDAVCNIDDDFSKLSTSELQYRLKFIKTLSKAQKKEIKRILKERK
jgi:predicted HAD superfamily phosphohydrolase